MTKQISVAVGSKNPTKVLAVKEVFEDVFKHVDIVDLRVESMVSRQPLNIDIIHGAHNRAKRAMELADTDYGVGIEAGLFNLGDRWYNLGFVVIINRWGELGTGTSGWFECPQQIVDEIIQGRELANVIDELSGTEDTRSNQGAIGLLTENRITRQDLYMHGVSMALIPFLNRDLWLMRKER